MAAFLPRFKTGREIGDAIRATLVCDGIIRPVIPSRSNRKTPLRWNKRIYCERNLIERMIGHLKMSRAIDLAKRGGTTASHINSKLIEAFVPRR